MRINGWQRLGIILSAVWLIVSSWAYFHELNNHPSDLAVYLPDSGYEWSQDLDTTNKAHEVAKQQGADFSERFVFLKPTFRMFGYLQFALTPIVICWLGVYLFIFIFRWVKRGFEI